MFTDRTPEFNEISNCIRSKNVLGPVNGVVDHTIRTTSKFLSHVTEISHGINACYVKLEELGKCTVCKTSSIFDDQTEKIDNLVSMIKMDVVHLKQEVENLGEIMNEDNLIKSQHNKNHRKSIVTSLEKKLAHASKDFKSLLELRTKKNRREEYSKSVYVPTLMNTGDTNNQPRSRNNNINSTRSETLIDMNGGTDMGYSNKPTVESGLQDQLLVVQETVPTYLQDRLNAVQTIESTIVELGDIFQQLAHLVNEQEEHIQRIDTNIDMAHLHVQSAHSELTRYLSSISSNRWLMIKIFGVLFIFIFMYILLT